jgi:hypothetical protein
MGILRRFSSKDPELKWAMSSALVVGGEVIPDVEGVATALRPCGFSPREFGFPNVQEVFVRCTVD